MAMHRLAGVRFKVGAFSNFSQDHLDFFKDMDEYFGLNTLKVIVQQPFVATSTTGKYDALIKVHGGGFTGQTGAIRHGISRALLEADKEFRPALKKAGYLTRDPRMKERKKYGLKAARRAPQFSKR